MKPNSMNLVSDSIKNLYFHMNVHSDFNCNSKKLETSPMSINR